jgi:RND family efflux transporter MFP subunit
MNMQSVIDRSKGLDKRILTGAALVAVVLVGLGSIGFGKASHEPRAVKEEALVSAVVVTVEPQTVQAVVSAAGALSSRNSSVLASKVMGKVAELNVVEGDRVSRGKVLVRIESGEIAAQAYQAQAAFNNASLQYDRIKSLFDEKAATRMEMDQATLGLESARAGLNAARAMESYTTIVAPISGQIVEKKINLGEMALPGQPILKIEDNRNLRLEATLKEQDIRFVRPGQAVTVRIDALPDREIKGRVALVVPAADIRTHSFIVKIDIPADRSLVTGMYGKAFFNMGRRDAILVPRSAIVNMGGLTGVYIVSADGNAVFQMIQPGDVVDDRVEAITGLKAGDRVVVSRHDAPLEGRRLLLAGSGT